MSKPYCLHSSGDTEGNNGPLPHGFGSSKRIITLEELSQLSVLSHHTRSSYPTPSSNHIRALQTAKMGVAARRSEYRKTNDQGPHERHSLAAGHRQSLPTAISMFNGSALNGRQREAIRKPARRSEGSGLTRETAILIPEDDLDKDVNLRSSHEDIITGYTTCKGKAPRSKKLPIDPDAEILEDIPDMGPARTAREGRERRMSSRSKGRNPGPWRYRVRSLPTERPEQANKDTGNECIAPDLAEDMKLEDMRDEETRDKAAHLVTVAPGLPVHDLYGFLLDYNGRLEDASRHAIRASMAPSSGNTAKFVPPSKDVHNSSGHGSDEEPMTKIEYNEADFNWDSDSPPPEPPRPKRKRTRVVPVKVRKNGRTKEKVDLTQMRGRERDSKSITVTRVEKSRPLQRRDNSITRFVVPDNIIYLEDGATTNSDMSSSDGDSSDGTEDTDTDMDEEEIKVLKINMHPRYAFNRELIGDRLA